MRARVRLGPLAPSHGQIDWYRALFDGPGANPCSVPGEAAAARRPSKSRKYQRQFSPILAAIAACTERDNIAGAESWSRLNAIL